MVYLFPKVTADSKQQDKFNPLIYSFFYYICHVNCIILLRKSLKMKGSFYCFALALMGSLSLQALTPYVPNKWLEQLGDKKRNPFFHVAISKDAIPI